MSKQEIKTEDTPPQSIPEKKKSGFRKAICIGSAVIFVPVVALVGMLSFDAGQRGLIRVVDNLLDDLSIEHIEGGLQQGLILQNIGYQTAGVDTKIAQARLQLDFGCLLSRKICVEDVDIKSPEIFLDTTKLAPSEQKQTGSSPMKKLSLPISLDVKNVTVDKLRFQLDQTHIDLEHFQSAVSLNNESGLILAPTELNKLNVKHVQPNPTKKPAEPKNHQPVDWDAIEQNLTPAFLGNLNEVNLPFDIHIPSLVAKDWQYLLQNEQSEELQRIGLSHLMLQADATGYEVQLKKLALESSLGNLDSQGSLQLNGDFPVDLSLTSALNAIQSEGKDILSKTDVQFSLSGSLKKTTALSLTTKGGLDAQLDGEVKLAEDKMPLNLTLKVSKGQYSFAENLMPLKINDVALTLSGDLLDYQAKLVGDVEGMTHIPHTHLSLDAGGKLYEAKINEFNLKTLDGSAILKGSASWKYGVKWEAKADLSNMNIRPYVPEMPAVLSGKLAVSGAEGSAGWHVDIPTLDLSGKLSNRPLSLKGNLLLSDKVLVNIPVLLLNYGENRLHAKGELSEQSDLTLDIHAPNLRGLYADVAGSVVGKATIKGKLSEPHVIVDLNTQNLHWQTLNIAGATIKGNLLSAPLLKGELSVKGGNIRYGDTVAIHSVNLTLTGDEKNHKLVFASQGKPAAANLQISGNFDRTSQQWKGTLSQVKIDTPIGEIKPNQSISVTYDNNLTQASIGTHCWVNSDVDLCFPQDFRVGEKGEIPFSVKRLNLNLVNKLTEQDMLKGQLRSEGKVAWFSDKPFMLNVSLNGDNLLVTQKLDYRTFKLAIPKLTLNTDIQNNNLTLKSDISVQNQGRIHTDLKLNDLSGARHLGGTFRIERLNLALLNQLFSHGENINGEIVSTLTLGGNLEKPLLNGHFDLRHLKTKLKMLPFEVTNGEMALRFDGTHSTLQGNIQTPAGSLRMNGRANWTNLSVWSTEVRAETENFKLDLPSIGKLRLSTNVLAKATPKLLELSGNVDIPWARIKVDALPENAEPVSEDEVILNGPRKSKEVLINREFASTTQSGMEIRSDLKINIGNDVHFDAYGFKSNLDGLLAVKQEKGRLGLYGQIDLKNGRYASFGQDLIIRKGQIHFAGLASQPMLNIEAIRNPDAMEDSKITAGVKVVGVATNPEVTVFSNPTKPQDQALSYLLTGRSLEDSGQAGSGGSVGAALLGMGLAKSSKLVGGIGEAFGIQDLNLGTAGVGDSSKVQVSGNIGKRLQVKYGVGLFDGLAEVTLRYRLLPQLYFQSVSSTNQVFDLLYQFEF
ncbi:MULTISPECIES: translocation/assembly module TamB domain-containing protein [unclassified Pasteurella]|uniref:autotransporter assembly complex protein TamB n=1 Tax=unclassified Pasteurella TaxID=2621516 RepID=UPI00107486E5|nr:translocation/assembly module TamB [Pasteurella sp. 19428wF3_WM03]TFU50820.1 translocation/assembly module TamB [Pasteurella sp. WM03]